MALLFPKNAKKEQNAGQAMQQPYENSPRQHDLDRVRRVFLSRQTLLGHPCFVRSGRLQHRAYAPGFDLAQPTPLP
jgi:hypothetical protein